MPLKNQHVMETATNNIYTFCNQPQGQCDTALITSINQSLREVATTTRRGRLRGEEP